MFRLQYDLCWKIIFSFCEADRAPNGSERLLRATILSGPFACRLCVLTRCLQLPTPLSRLCPLPGASVQSALEKRSSVTNRQPLESQ